MQTLWILKYSIKIFSTRVHHLKNNSIISTHLHLLHNFCRAKLNSVKQKQAVSKPWSKWRQAWKYVQDFEDNYFLTLINFMSINCMNSLWNWQHFISLNTSQQCFLACINGFYILNLNFEYDWYIYIYIYIYIYSHVS